MDRARREGGADEVLPGQDRGLRSRGPLEARRSRRLLSLRDTQRAMSQENVEIVRAFYAAYNRGDLDAVLNDLAPDFTLDWSRAMGPQRGVYGADRVRQFFDDFAEIFEQR